MGGAEPASTVDPIGLNGDLRLPFPAERIGENEAARIVLIGPAGLLFEGADLASDGDRAARLSLELEIAKTNHEHQIESSSRYLLAVPVSAARDCSSPEPRPDHSLKSLDLCLWHMS